VEKYCRARQAIDDTIQHMRTAIWITEATDKHLEYVNTYCCFTATVVSRKCLGITLYV